MVAEHARRQEVIHEIMAARSHHRGGTSRDPLQATVLLRSLPTTSGATSDADVAVRCQLVLWLQCHRRDGHRLGNLASSKCLTD